MKRNIKRDLLVFGLLLMVFLIVIQYLPPSIPIHFNSKGKATHYVNRYYFLFVSVIFYSLYRKFQK
ncbi:MAG: DUF1648 domain-containing protein [Tissierellia bacterium]|nr:DUF1648 domain-containing protein [Tissierellia bacterium]